MLAARLPGNSTYDNLRQAGTADTGGCLIPADQAPGVPDARLLEHGLAGRVGQTVITAARYRTGRPPAPGAQAADAPWRPAPPLT